MNFSLIEEAITDYYGARCPDYVRGCPCCDAWEAYDELKRLLDHQMEKMARLAKKREQELLEGQAWDDWRDSLIK